MEPTNGAIAEKRIPLHTDKIVCRLELFPELVQALREENAHLKEDVSFAQSDRSFDNVSVRHQRER